MSKGSSIFKKKKKTLFMKNPGKKIYQSLWRNLIELILSILFKEKMIFLKYEKDKLFFYIKSKRKNVKTIFDV